MDTHLSEQGIRFREYRFDDVPALVDILNRTYPDNPTTVENEEHFEKTYPADNPRLRFAVETGEGKFVGAGACLKPFWMNAPGVYDVFGIVDPDWRQRGIGQALLARFEPYARSQGAARLWTGCREDFDFSIHFLERAGFTNYGVRFESKLDLETFDESRFAGAVERITNSGFEVTTLAAERESNPDADRRLYELEMAFLPDVPLPGGARFEFSYEEFRRMMLDRPDSDPSAILIARHGSRYVGATALELAKNAPAYTATTGVLREYRGQGLALALKLLSIRLMQGRGYTSARTNNDTANPAILHLNEKLGYQRLPGWLQWEKPL